LQDFHDILILREQSRFAKAFTEVYPCPHMWFSLKDWSLLIPQDALIIALVVLALSTLILSVLLWILLRRTHRLFVGYNATSIADSIRHLSEAIEEQNRFRDEVSTYLLNVEGRLRRSTQGISTVRFDAFKGRGGGGEQSFVTAFLNERGDGVVLSSIQFRERVSIYAKPIKEYSSELKLSAEEQEAVSEARQKLRDIHTNAK